MYSNLCMCCELCMSCLVNMLSPKYVLWTYLQLFLMQIDLSCVQGLKSFKMTVLSSSFSVVASDYFWRFPWLCIEFTLINQSVPFLHLWFCVLTLLYLHRSLSFPGSLYWIFSTIFSFKQVHLKEVIRFRDKVLFLQLGNHTVVKIRWLASPRRGNHTVVKIMMRCFLHKDGHLVDYLSLQWSLLYNFHLTDRELEICVPAFCLSIVPWLQNPVGAEHTVVFFIVWLVIPLSSRCCI
jgi:hypothetical protein